MLNLRSCIMGITEMFIAIRDHRICELPGLGGLLGGCSSQQPSSWVVCGRAVSAGSEPFTAICCTQVKRFPRGDKCCYLNVPSLHRLSLIENCLESVLVIRLCNKLPQVVTTAFGYPQCLWVGTRPKLSRGLWWHCDQLSAGASILLGLSQGNWKSLPKASGAGCRYHSLPRASPGQLTLAAAFLSSVRGQRETLGETSAFCTKLNGISSLLKAGPHPRSLWSTGVQIPGGIWGLYWAAYHEHWSQILLLVCNRSPLKPREQGGWGVWEGRAVASMGGYFMEARARSTLSPHKGTGVELDTLLEQSCPFLLVFYYQFSCHQSLDDVSFSMSQIYFCVSFFILYKISSFLPSSFPPQF